MTLVGPSVTTIDSMASDASRLVQATNRVITIITAGKSGSGKSTLVCNLLQLRGKYAPKAGHAPSSVSTQTTEVYWGEIKGLNVQIVDINLAASDEKGVQALITELKSTTGGSVDVLLYCVSMLPNSKIETVDEQIIKVLMLSFGKGVWDRAILVLTFANVVKKLSVQGKANSVGETLRKYTVGFQEKLQSTDCSLKNYTVVAYTSKQNAYSEPNPLHRIVAVPAGCESKEVVINNTPWNESIYIEILNKIM